MNLTNYTVQAIIYPYGEHRFGKSVPILDEGSFYRIGGTHILDKYRIKEFSINGGELKIIMTDKTVILEVEV